MSATKLRAEIKKAIDRLTPDRLESVADYVNFLARPSLDERLKQAEKDVAAGKTTPWRKVRDDV